MKKIFINLGAISLISIGGFWLYNSPSSEKTRQINRWPDQEMIDEGFREWNREIYIKWIDKSCRTNDYCKQLLVITRFGCPNSLVGQMTWLDRNDVNIGTDGAIAVGVEPKQKALLEFNAFNVNNLAKWKLNKLLCY